MNPDREKILGLKNLMTIIMIKYLVKINHKLKFKINKHPMIPTDL